MTINDIFKNGLNEGIIIKGFNDTNVIKFSKKEIDSLKDYIGKDFYIAETYSTLSTRVQEKNISFIVKLISVKESGFSGINKSDKKIEGFYLYPVN